MGGLDGGRSKLTTFVAIGIFSMTAVPGQRKTTRLWLIGVLFDCQFLVVE